MAETQSYLERAWLFLILTEVVPVVGQVLCFDLIPKFVIDLTLEWQYVIIEVEVHNLTFAFGFEYTAQILQILDLPVKEQLWVRELIVLVTGNVPLNLKWDTTNNDDTI